MDISSFGFISMNRSFSGIEPDFWNSCRHDFYSRHSKLISIGWNPAGPLLGRKCQLCIGDSYSFRAKYWHLRDSPIIFCRSKQKC